MANDLAICYVSDRDFLLGTFLSIQSIRRYVGAESAQIYLFTIGLSDKELRTIKEYGASRCIRVQSLDINNFTFDGSHWNKTHVPTSTLGRFFLEPHLDSTIERILYIDGDTLFTGDPTPLLSFCPQAGMMAAVEDISYFTQRDFGKHGRRVRAYLEGLKVDGAGGYLNAGVLFASRSAWRNIMADAARFFAAHPEKCKYHDQSALNAVIGPRRIRLSPIWNFQTPFRYWGVEGQLKPRVYHFTEFPKPWMGPAHPWEDMQRALDELSAGLDALDLPNNRLSQEKLGHYDRQNKARRNRLWTVFLWRLLGRRRSIRELARQAVL